MFILLALLAGILIGYGVGRGKRMRLPERDHSTQTRTAVHRERPGSRKRASQTLLVQALGDRDIKQMNADELLEQLFVLRKKASYPRYSPLDHHAASYRMLLMIRDLPQSEVVPVLEGMTRSSSLDPETWGLAAELAEMLMERMVDHDLESAIL